MAAKTLPLNFVLSTKIDGKTAKISFGYASPEVFASREKRVFVLEKALDELVSFASEGSDGD